MNLFILYLPFYEWFSVLHVGWLVTVQVRVLEFLLFKESLWKKKIVVARVNGTQHTKVSAVTVAANTVQTLDVLMTVVNAGRMLKMRKQEIIYIAVDNKDADCFLDELCKPGIITDTCLRVDRKKKMIET